MPYITEEKRAVFDKWLAQCPDMHGAGHYGDLAYVVFRLMDKNLKSNSWTRMSTIIGSVLGAVREWQKRRVDKYEESKRLENGDII